MHLSDTVLKEVKDLNDLGILTDNALSFISHSDMITAKVNRMLGLIKITSMDLKDESSQETAPMLGWVCSVVWCPFIKRYVNKLDITQRRATRFILKSNEPYDVRLSKLNLLIL